MLFHIGEILKEATYVARQDSLEASSSSYEENLLHLKHWMRFMDKDFEQVKLLAMASEREVSWEMLWVFFPFFFRRTTDLNEGRNTYSAFSLYILAVIPQEVAVEIVFFPSGERVVYLDNVTEE